MYWYLITGEMNDVGDTGYELRTSKRLKIAIEELAEADGFDINYCLNHSTIQPGFNFAARYITLDSVNLLSTMLLPVIF